MRTLTPGAFELATDEGTLHYQIAGTGPACIAVSGGPGVDPRYFEDLGGITDVLTLVTLHPRGAGLSRFPDESDWSLTAYARDVELLRQHLALERPLVLGHSHGGWVAQQYALNHPTGLGKLILLDTAAAGLAALKWDPEETIRPYRDEPWFASAYAALTEDFSPETTPEQASASLAAIMPFYFACLTPEVQAFLARVSPLSVNPAPHIRGNGPEQFASDRRSQLPNIQVPTLVIVGRHDFIQTLPMAEELARLIPGAQLAVCEQSGHFPWVEERERFHQIIQGFV